MRHLRQPRTGQRSTVVAYLADAAGGKDLQKQSHMKIKAETAPDVLVRNESTVFLFCPLTPQAKERIDEYVQSDAQWFGNALVVEHRYAWGLAEGMKEEGLVLA
jgi:hypothetical protein